MAFLRIFALVAAVIISFAGLSTPSQAQLFGSSDDDAATNVRLNDLEERLRSLTGQIENLNYQMRTLEDQIRRMQEDNEYRLQQLEGQGGRKRSDATPNGASPTQSAQYGALAGQTNGGGFGPAAGTVEPQGSGDADFEAPLAGSGPIDLSALARGGASTGATNAAPPPPTALPGVSNELSNALPDGQTASLARGADPRSDYNQAYSSVLNGDYSSAEQAFKLFLKNYPNHELAPSAQYWLGESQYARGQFRESADTFLKTYTQYPQGSKVSDSLFKLGLSLKGLGERDAACATFSELLTKYPAAPSAVRAQAQSEQQTYCS